MVKRTLLVLSTIIRSTNLLKLTNQESLDQMFLLKIEEVPDLLTATLEKAKA